MTRGQTPITAWASVIRSKNSGPYRISFDILFSDERLYALTKNSGVITREYIANLYRVPTHSVTVVRFFDPGNAIKISMKRPVTSGDPGDNDVYGCQQHVPLFSIRIPSEKKK